MTSEASSGQIPSSNLLQGSQAIDLAVSPPGGKALPTAGNNLPPPAVSTNPAGARSQGTAASPGGGRAGNAQSSGTQSASPQSPGAHSSSAQSVDPQTMVDILNKNLNDSGRPDEFRLDPSSTALIQQINPANGQVVGEFSVEEFPALARSVGATGLIVDSRA